MDKLNKIKPRDINLERGIGERHGKLDYFVFNQPALNGSSQNLSDERNEAEKAYQIESVIKINVPPLQQDLDKYLPEGQSIDFMSADVEVLDLHVLKSDNCKIYRPRYVQAEILW